MSEVTVDHPVAGVAVITLNRPDRLNALTEELFEELGKVTKEVDRDQTVRAVIVTGAGRGFCSGHDLSEIPLLANDTPAQRLARLDCHSGVQPGTMSKPVIAAVNGPARGGGMSLAAACDLRLAAESATFANGAISLGFSGADWGLSWTLPRVIGYPAAAELMFTGRAVDAHEALALGLVSRVVPDDQLMVEAIGLASAIAQNDLLALQLTKRALVSSAATSLQSAMCTENSNVVIAMMHHAARSADDYMGLAKGR